MLSPNTLRSVNQSVEYSEFIFDVKDLFWKGDS